MAGGHVEGRVPAASGVDNWPARPPRRAKEIEDLGSPVHGPGGTAKIRREWPWRKRD